MRLHQIALSVTDLDAAETFYREVVGARLVARFDVRGLVFFDLGGVRLMLESGQRAAEGAAVYFHVDDLEAAVANLRAKGVSFTAGPQAVHTDEAGLFGTPGETERMAFFRDPAGNTLALATRKPPSAGTDVGRQGSEAGIAS